MNWGIVECLVHHLLYNLMVYTIKSWSLNLDTALANSKRCTVLIETKLISYRVPESVSWTVYIRGWVRVGSTMTLHSPRINVVPYSLMTKISVLPESVSYMLTTTLIGWVYAESRMTQHLPRLNVLLYSLMTKLVSCLKVCRACLRHPWSADRIPMSRLMQHSPRVKVKPRS